MTKYLRIKDIGNVISGSTPKTGIERYWNGNISWVTPKEMSQLNTQFLNETERKITYEGFKSCSTIIIPKGNVLFTSRAPIGLVAVNNIDVCTNQGFKSIILNQGISALYVYYYLKLNKKRLNDLGTGTTFKELSKSTFEKFEIPIPPLPTQLHIANLLSKAEQLIAQRKESIRLLDEYVKSVFVEMFGDPVRNEKGWKKNRLEQLLEIRGRVGWKGYKKTDLRESGPYVLGATHLNDLGEIDLSQPVYISREKFNESTEIVIQKNDIIIVQRGNTIGKIGRVKDLFGEATINPCVLIMRPLIVDSAFLKQYFLNNNVIAQLWKLNNASAQPMITQGDLKRFEIYCPPHSLQTQFAQIVEKTEALKTRFQKSMNELESLYGCLSQQAFRGEIALPE
jgi:type I restriction enzyme S subunit